MSEKKYRSVAQWSSKRDDISTDEHETEEQAQAVCKMLEREGAGGMRKVFPYMTWTEPIK